MTPSHRGHDISDRTWELLEPHLPGREGVRGSIAKDNRLFINAVFWILCTGAPWRDLPPDLGDWKNVQRRFCRNHATTLRRGIVQTAASGRERIPASQTLARYRHPIRQTYRAIPRRRANQVHRSLGGYLVTTLSKMPIIIMLLSLLLVPSIVLAEEIYVAQKTAGFDDGASCASAHAATWFNMVGNWGSGAGKISGGDTVHLCGTITSPMVVQASGSVGSPITVLFESEAKISQPVCSALTACFNMSNKTYIILDGGTNGIVEATDNGTPPIYANQSIGIGVVAHPCSNCEIKNLTVRNMYVHLVDLNDKAVAYSQVNAIKFSGSNTKVHHNILHDAGWALYQNYGNGDRGVEIYNNEIYHSSHGWTVAGSGAISASHFKFYKNYIHDYSNWDTTPTGTPPQSPYHHDGIHAFGIGGAVGDAYDIYNNMFGGKCGTTMTAHVYMEGNSASRWTINGTVRIFNNVFICESLVFGLTQIGAGHGEIYNNTIIGSGLDQGTCLVLWNTKNAIVKNNAISGCRFLLSITGTTTIANPVTDLNYNTYGSCGSMNCFHWEGVAPFQNAFATWQSQCGCDVQSTKNVGLLVHTTGRPMAGSPLIGAGENLTSLAIANLNKDRVLVPRASIGVWSAGAYEPLTSNPPPAPPTNLIAR